MRADTEREMVSRVLPVDSEFVRPLVMPAVAIRRAKAELDLFALGEVSRVE